MACAERGVDARLKRFLYVQAISSVTNVTVRRVTNQRSRAIKAATTRAFNSGLVSWLHLNQKFPQMRMSLLFASMMRSKMSAV